VALAAAVAGHHLSVPFQTFLKFSMPFVLDIRALFQQLFALLIAAFFLGVSVPRDAHACGGQAQPDVEGTMLVVQEDDFIWPSRVKYAVLTHDENGNPLKLDIEAPDDASLIPEGLETGMQVTLHGDVAPAASALPGEESEAGTAKFVLNPNPTASKTGFPIEIHDEQPAALAEGAMSVSRKLAVVIIDFSDSVVGCTNGQIDATVFTGTQSIANAYSRSSYGNVTFNRDSDSNGQPDIYRVSIPYSAASASCSYSTWTAAADTAVQTQFGVNDHTYDRRLYFFGNGVASCGWAGLGTVGGGSYGFAIVNGQYCSYGDVGAHELGHNETMQHSATDSDNNGTLEQEYGDRSDIMGYSGVGMRHFNAPHKIQMGWMPAGNIATVTTNQTLTLTGLEQNVSATQVIKAARSATGGGDYYLSYRVDDGVLTGLPSTYKNVTSVHWFNGYSYTYLVQTLSDGQTFTDPVSGISFTQNSHTSTTASITVVTGATDSQAPTAAIASAPNLTAYGGSTYSFSVQYSDNVGVNVSSLNTGDVRVTGPNSYDQVATFVSVNTNSNGTPRIATYSIPAPSGSWTSSANGTYSIAVQSSQVSDTTTNYVAASTLGTFAVNITDSVAPTANLASVPSVSVPGATTYSFTVRYADNIAVNTSTMGYGNIRVTGPNGYNQLPVYLGADQQTNGTPRVGTYRITPPGGSWDAADDGTYSIAVVANTVGDTSGNKVPAGTLGSFQVSTGVDSDGDGITDAQENLDGTNPHDRGSGQRSLGTTLCSEWNGFLGGMWNIMELVNLSTRDMQAQILFYDQSGNQTYSDTVAIPAGQQHDELVHDFPGRLLNSYGKVCVVHDGSAGELDGRMVYYKRNDAAHAANGKEFQFAFAMPFSNGKTGNQYVGFNTYQPSLAPADQGNAVANWLQITNLSTTASGGVLRFHGMDGGVLGDTRVELNGGQRFDVSGHQFGASLVGVVEWMPDRNDILYTLRNVRYLYDNATGSDSFATAFQLEGDYGSGDALTVPLTAEGETPIVEVSNTKPSAISVTVNVYSADGTLLQNYVFPLDGYASRHLILDSAVGSALRGVAIVQSNTPESVIAMGMQYGRYVNGGISYMYGVPARSGFGSVLRGSYNTFLNQDSEIWLTNTSSQTQNISVQLMRSTGLILQNGVAVTLPAHGVRVLRVNDYEAGDNYGVATVQGQSANSVVAWIERRKANDYVIPAPVRQ